MASEVDICNAALAFLGDSASVSSINPPDQSAQAGHCSRFYPMARDALLEMHAWGFATVRIALAYAPSNPSSTWQYCYLAPSDVLNYLAVLDPNASDDYSTGMQFAGTAYSAYQPQLGIYTPQPFQVETLEDGTDILFTNMQDAVLRYTRVVTDTGKFSPLFTEALSMLLAGHLAGPLLKGAEGRATAKELMTEFFSWWKEKATESDTNQRRENVLQSPKWMAFR